MVRFRMLESVLFLSFVVTGVHAQVTPHRVVPLNTIPSEQWIEVVGGDPSKVGAAFVLRIHNDAGYVWPPHTPPTDENMVVVQGSWSVGLWSFIFSSPTMGACQEFGMKAARADLTRRPKGGKWTDHFYRRNPEADFNPSTTGRGESPRTSITPAISALFDNRTCKW